MRDLLVVLYSNPGLFPITGMCLAGVVVVGWDLVKLAAGRLGPPDQPVEFGEGVVAVGRRHGRLPG